MTDRSWRNPLALVSMLALVPAAVSAEVRMPALFGDHMVLQADHELGFFGWADPGEEVTVSLAGKSATTRGDAQGRFELKLTALEAGGPHELTVVGSNRLRFTDVWLGEVWVASGQSNMEMPLANAFAADELSAAGCSGLRLFQVARKTALSELDDVEATWEECRAESAPPFSAVALFFGRRLAAALGVKVGLIQSAWGGTPAEAWTPRSALAEDPAFSDALVALALPEEQMRELRKQHIEKMMAWEAQNYAPDPPNRGLEEGRADPAFDDSGWELTPEPQYWETSGLSIDGVVWFRRAVELPEAWAGKELTLDLGAIDDFDTTYFNGTRVGATGAETLRYYEARRHYTVPGELVRAGRNVIAVRVFDHYGNGGFAGPAAEMKLSCPGCDAPLPLAGPWAQKVETEIPPGQPNFSTQPRPPAGVDDPNSPTVLYNGMIAPLRRYPIRGVIWYQGESNAGRAWQYRTLFPTLIRSWRDAWGLPDLPFLYVQLANYRARLDAPGESDWAELREAQLLALGVPHTGMAVTIDIGNGDDIHPRNKEEVGRRLYLIALAEVYGRKLESSGPRCLDRAVEGDRIRVRFEHARGLAPRGGAPLLGFAIAGEDRRFRWAEAAVEGDSVVVSHPEVPEPVAVRYGWADNPACNLRNGAGLPASPFRTDDWPGLTGPPR